jgi:hypothetical protein
MLEFRAAICTLKSRAMSVSNLLRRLLLSRNIPFDTFRRDKPHSKKRNDGWDAANLGRTTYVAPTTEAQEIVFRLRQSANDPIDLDKNYQVKEHALFSCLERHGITG